MRPPASLFTLLAVVAVAGCGKEEHADGGGAAQPLNAGETLRVSAREYSFAPAAVVLSGGGAVRIRLRNDGSLAHNLRLRRDGKEVGGTPACPPAARARPPSRSGPGATRCSARWVTTRSWG